MTPTEEKKNSEQANVKQEEMTSTQTNEINTCPLNDS